MLAAFAVGALLLAACGDDGGDGDGATGGTDATGATGATGSTGEGIRVAVLLPGTPSDQGYNADGQRAADAIESELGAEVTVTESVPVPNQTDVYRQFAGQGFDLVIGWGGQFTDGALAAAEEFPDVNFLVVNSGVENGTNLASVAAELPGLAVRRRLRSGQAVRERQDRPDRVAVLPRNGAHDQRDR